MIHRSIPPPVPLRFAVAALAAVAVAAPARGGVECPPAGTVTRDGWSVDYLYTGTDGLEVFDASYEGVEVLRSAKLLEWHSDGGASGFVLVTGCGGSGGGFPIYPYGDAQVLDLPGSADGVAGFEIVADFRMANWGQDCHFRFEQRFQFYEDGGFRVVAGAYGRHCSTVSVNRPVLRIDLAPAGDDDDSAALWNGSAWVAQATEFLRTPYAGPDGPLAYDPHGFALRVLDQTTEAGFFVEPDRGQLGQAQADDEPFVYVTLFHAAEGTLDLGVLGTCCNDDEEQGPEEFVDGEAIAGSDLVLWYVPQMITDSTAPDYFCWTVAGEPNPETYPCFGGPRFAPTPRIFADGFETGGAGRWTVATP